MRDDSGFVAGLFCGFLITVFPIFCITKSVVSDDWRKQAVIHKAAYYNVDYSTGKSVWAWNDEKTSVILEK